MPTPDSADLANYIEATDGLGKPWLLVQLRLQKLREQQHELGPEVYTRRLAELHQELMQLGEWWLGIEDDVF